VSPDPLLAVRGLRKRMRRAGSLRSASEDVEVLRGVDLDVEEGGIQAVVGASGAGKTTLAFAALGLLRPDAGTVLFEGRDLGVLPASALRALRPRLQAVFQDPWGSLTPHRSLRALLVEPLEVHGIARGREAEARAARALDEVGLDRALLAVKPGSLSGGAGAGWSATSPPARSTSRSRPGSSPCWRAGGRSAAWPASSSPTTSPSRGRSPTGWP